MSGTNELMVLAETLLLTGFVGILTQWVHRVIYSVFRRLYIPFYVKMDDTREYLQYQVLHGVVFYFIYTKYTNYNFGESLIYYFLLLFIVNGLMAHVYNVVLKVQKRNSFRYDVDVIEEYFEWGMILAGQGVKQHTELVDRLLYGIKYEGADEVIGVLRSYTTSGGVYSFQIEITDELEGLKELDTLLTNKGFIAKRYIMTTNSGKD